ncbi:hypothetical protein BGZ83_001989 [Gryganskiella cystojenkinii]|nr:hypothetical protein BGZ83_001989 [Gryganskiella cystojenkinii]
MKVTVNQRYLRRKILIPCLLSIVISVNLLFFIFPYVIVDLGYLLRPLWDKGEIKFDETIIHYYAEGMSMESRCIAHGWTAFNSTAGTQRQKTLYDAVIFSVELDMLEIRLREMWDVVDKFVILESDKTFTGLEKKKVFADNRERFAFAESKIHYKFVPLPPLPEGQKPWYLENMMRSEMTDFLVDLGIQDGDLTTFSDVDEVISKRTLELFKYCEGGPQEAHMQLRNHLYSYEFPVREMSWRSQIVHWQQGWHCSFCFKTLEEFRFKMTGYSHADRVRSPALLEYKNIQKAICDGTDLYGMLPEAFTFKELLTRLGAIPKSTTGVGLPYWVLENPKKFKYLLPGGCIRENGDRLSEPL